MKSIFTIISLIFFLSTNSFSQTHITLKGYVSVENNQGFVKDALITLRFKGSEKIIKTTTTDEIGEFVLELKPGEIYEISIHKEIYHDIIKTIDSDTKNDDNNIFFKVQMIRKPGYTFEISLTEVKSAPFAPVDGITDALIEVYNNTKNKLVTSFKNDRPNFNINLNKGNHYTILIRKNKYLAKELQAYLNVNGCIICFHGVSKMQPGIKTRLMKNNTVGKYLANIEMEKAFAGKKIEIKNIYYDLNKANLKTKSTIELDKLAKTLTLNPKLLIELGSHTDCRGSDAYNLKLSAARAKAAVSYLTLVKNIKKHRITFKGYGETELTNKCDDGVKCSEKQHAKNRRTEIKILNIIQDPSVDFVPLAIIKDNERMEKKLKNLLNSDSEIIEIKDGNIPDAIRKDLDKNYKGKEKNNQTKKQSLDKPKTTKENKLNISKDTDNKLNSFENFTGFKIVILFTRYQLPKGHIMFKNVKDIEEYNNEKEGYVLYLVGSYNTYKLAKSDLDKKWKKRFKKAYIAEFKNGLKI